jgi:hypothetical protein
VALPSVPAADLILYTTERFGLQSPPYLTYSFPLPSGLSAVRVRMHFAEIFDLNDAVGLRTFNVRAQNTLALVNMDIFQEAGLFKPVIKEFLVTDVSSGLLTLTFEPPSNGFTLDGPKVSGIEVFIA